MPAYSIISSDVSMTMILNPGPVIDFLRVNQGIQDSRYIDWHKVIHKTTPEKPGLCFFLFLLLNCPFTNATGQENAEKHESQGHT